MPAAKRVGATKIRARSYSGRRSSGPARTVMPSLRRLSTSSGGECPATVNSIACRSAVSNAERPDEQDPLAIRMPARSGDNVHRVLDDDHARHAGGDELVLLRI